MTVKTAGIHISGSNAPRSALVTLTGNVLDEPLRIHTIYEKIGSTSELFSDERIVGIIQHEAPLVSLFVDCPLTVPPCVACQRPVCPGAVACEDLSVAYMLSLTGQIKRTGARKKRPFNPQSQRLWDVTFQASAQEGFEPTYSANYAPLIVRAQTLQRRLAAINPNLKLEETAVPHALRRLCEHLGIDPHYRFSYRSFEYGKTIRRELIKAMVSQYWLSDSSQTSELMEKVSQSVDVFHAFIAALSASLYCKQLTASRPQHYPHADGWVHLPKFESAWPQF